MARSLIDALLPGPMQVALYDFQSVEVEHLIAERVNEECKSKVDKGGSTVEEDSRRREKGVMFGTMLLPEV